MTSDTSRARENRLRRRARRRGLKLSRSHRRDVGAIDFGKYALFCRSTGKVVTPPVGEFLHSMNLDAIEAFLEGKRK